MQVFLVGMLIGGFRTVVPLINELESGLSDNSLEYVTSIVLIFGLVKAISNLVSGTMSDYIGRRKVLLLGWLAALPIPYLLIYVQNWTVLSIVLVLLGVHQGLAWSMTQSAKIDIADSRHRGNAMGLNEFSGYLGVAVAGFVTSYFAEIISPISTIVGFTTFVVLVGLFSALISIQETKQSHTKRLNTLDKVNQSKLDISTWFQIFKQTSWHDKKMMALCQAGLIEKFVDALVWIFFPIYFYQQGLKLTDIGIVVAIYGVVWGALQLLTGRLSDMIGRVIPIVAGMIICAIGVALVLIGSGFFYWSCCSLIIGLGMALLYPNLSAAVADLAHSKNHAETLGIYRFWRDCGYSVAGILFVYIAQHATNVADAFILVSIAMVASSVVVVVYLSPKDKAYSTMSKD